MEFAKYIGFDYQDSEGYEYEKFECPFCKEWFSICKTGKVKCPKCSKELIIEES